MKFTYLFHTYDDLGKNECLKKWNSLLKLIVEDRKSLKIFYVRYILPCKFFSSFIIIFSFFLYKPLNHKTAWKIRVRWFNGSNDTQNILIKLEKSDKATDLRATFNNILCLVNCLFVPKIKNTYVHGLVLPTFRLFLKTPK